jgi:lipoprotein-anchoring transpeptidase ErfK/SrfK
MFKLRHNAVNFGLGLLITLMVFAFSFSNTVYGAESNPTDYSIQQKLDNGFFVLKFTNPDKHVVLKPGNSIFYSGNTEAFTEQPIMANQQGEPVLTPTQVDFITTNTDNDQTYRIRKGIAIDRVTYREGITIYQTSQLTNPIATVPVGQEVRVLQTLLDGKFKVLTPDWRIGYADTRMVRILSDNLPPLAGKLSKNSINPEVILVVSQDEQLLRVYRHTDTDYALEKEIIVSTGEISEHTPNGYFLIKPTRGKWFYNPQYSAGGKNYVQFRGNYLLHSVACDINGQPIPAKVQALGKRVSSGCIGMPIDDSQYIYHTAKANTLLVIDNPQTDINDILKNTF